MLPPINKQRSKNKSSSSTPPPPPPTLSSFLPSSLPSSSSIQQSSDDLQIIQSNNHSKKYKNNQKIIRSSISCPSSTNNFYSYRIFPGNNTRVIINSFRKRKLWRPYSEQQVTNLNLIWEMYRNPKRYENNKYKRIVLNHLQNNSCLVTKKGLYQSLKRYCQETSLDISSIIPLTFFIPDPSREDINSDLDEFLNYCRIHDPENQLIWILKPAYCSNRGSGITVVRGLNEVLVKIGLEMDSENIMPSTQQQQQQQVEEEERGENQENEQFESKSASHRTTSRSVPTTTTTRTSTTSSKGWIVQSYLLSPLLIHGRKFDIRCYVLLFLSNGIFHAFYYPTGYIRTSSKKYSLKSLHDREVHLTNDAIQKKSKLYGKHENGNKLTYEELEEIINESNQKNRNSNNHSNSNNSIPEENIFHLYILPQIKQQIIHSIKSTKEKLLNSSIKSSFELLGYDFMIDSSFKSYLIEINSNPCLEFACPMLERLISSVIEGVFQVVVDKLYPSPYDNDEINENEERTKFEELNLDD